MLSLFRHLRSHATPARITAAICSAAVLTASGVAWAAGIH